MIDVKNLTKRFGDLVVLDGVSEHIDKGECVVVIGPSGSGKSTFLRCLNLLETPTSGEILFDGVSMTDPKTDINKMRQKMGMVFQHFNLFPNMTILKNITLAPVRTGADEPREEAEQKAMELLDRVGLADKASAYPAQLSGGQKQRVAIVRALCMEPEVMLFDEPTSALDPEMVGEVLDVMKRAGPAGHDHGGRDPRDGLCPRGGHRVVFLDGGKLLPSRAPPRRSSAIRRPKPSFPPSLIQSTRGEGVSVPEIHLPGGTGGGAEGEKKDGVPTACARARTSP